MIPVFQTRYAVETFGNCFEACLASILEVPLSSIPDRAALVDQDAWADDVAQARIRGGEDAVLDLELPPEYDDGERIVRLWLQERGLAWIDCEIGKAMPMTMWFEIVGRELREAYWISHNVTTRQWKHATVWQGLELVHDPQRGAGLDWRRLGTLTRATLLVAGDPAKIARLNPLPDVAGALNRALRANAVAA